jgi:hypothetical protein
MVAELCSWVEGIEEFLERKESEDIIQDYSDIWHGVDYLDLVEDGKTDMVTGGLRAYGAALSGQGIKYVL